MTLEIKAHKKMTVKLVAYLRAVCMFMGPKKEVCSWRAFLKYCPV